MSCKDRDKFKTSEASSKASLRTRGAIDVYLNILDTNIFRKLNKKWTANAKERFKINGPLFYEENNKAIPNKEAFGDIDSAKGFNKLTQPLRSIKESTDLSEEDVKKLLSPLNKTSLQAELTTNIVEELSAKVFSLNSAVPSTQIELEQVNLFVKKIDNNNFSIAVDNKGTNVFGKVSAVLDFQRRDLESNSIYAPNPNGFILWDKFLESDTAKQNKAKVIVDNRFNIAIGTLTALQQNGIESIHFPSRLAGNFSKEYGSLLKQNYSSIKWGENTEQSTTEINIEDLIRVLNLANNKLAGDAVYFQANNAVNYALKSVDILSSDKAKKVFDKGQKNGWDLNKIFTELQVPKDQRILIIAEYNNMVFSNSEITTEPTLDELVLQLASKYSYAVEINTAKNDASEMDFNKPDEIGTFKNSSYYSNLTVPGGTNYTENEIATPFITPGIKGHAQFSTANGIGWFRSDDQGFQVADANPTSSNSGGIYSDGKTRRILEVQSDLFQKSRDRKDLISYKPEESKEYVAEHFNSWAVYNSEIGVIESGFATKEAAEKWLTPKDNKNDFLQLLNKDSNWVTFFVKSIIQDSQKKGYEKVLFPTGNTASKVEGHTTLEEFKKTKEDRLIVLEKLIEAENQRLSSVKNEMQLEQIEDSIQKHNKETNQLKKELSDIEGPGGFGALKPIYNFYENTVTNILNKTYGKDNVNTVTDENGNTWNEVTLVEERDTANILLQKVEAINKAASTKTMKVVNDFLKRIGVDVTSVKKIVVNGRIIDANAVANITQALVQIVEGKEAQSLPEEAMHFAVEILEQTNPTLFKQLLKEVNKFATYKEVLADYGNNEFYQTKDGKPDILKLKKEAIGKILAEVITNQSEGINETPERTAEAQAWWNKILDYIKNLFTTSGFNQAAMDILSGKNIGTAADIRSEGEFFQLANDKQTQIFDSLKELSDKIVNDGDGYLIDGRRIKTRVSNLVSEWYDRRFKASELTKTEFQNAVNDLKAEKGTAGHADIEHIYEVFVDATTGLIRDEPLEDSGYVSLLNPNNRDMYNILFENMKERLASFPKGTKFLSEIIIYDAKRDIAGTIDFLAINPEGKVSILDWKFMDLNISKYTDIPWYKINAWNTQMEQYKYIINRVYGVKNENFEQTRMIPIKAVYSEANPKTNTLPTLMSIQIGAVNVKNIQENYLIPVGLEAEKTGIKKIDNLLEKLNAIYKKLSEEKVLPSEKLNKAEQLNALFSAIRQLQMKQNVVPLVYQAKVLNKQIQGILDTYDSKFKGKNREEFTEAEISAFSESLELAGEALETYVNLDTELRFLFLGDLSEEDKQTKEDLKDTVDAAREYKDILSDIDTDFITEFIGGTSAPEKIVRGITKMFGNTATIQLKGLESLFKKANKTFFLSGVDTLTEVKRLTAIKESYQKWARAKGLTASNQFDIIKKKDSNELINEFDKTFYSELKSKIADKDFAWVRANVDVTSYNAFLKDKKIDEYKRIEDKPRVGSTLEVANQIRMEKEKVDNLYNTSAAESPGWLLYDLINKFPKRDLWESAEWKELHKSGNEPAVEFYHYIIEKNKEYTDIGYIHAKQSRVFLPWVRKGFTEKLIFGGNITIGEQFLRGISIDEGDVGYGKIDPLTGKPINSIPKYFTTKIEGEVSTDLFKTIAMYNEMAIKFKYLTDIEAQARALIRLEKNKKAIATSYFGKTEYKDGVMQYTPDNAENTKLVEDMVKAIIYQQKYIQSDSFDQILTTLGGFGKTLNDKLGYKILPEDLEGRQVSVNKIITQMNNSFQVITLGLNPLSSFSNLFGGKTQSFINSGKYFTKEDFVSTEMWLLGNKMNGENKGKMLAALEYFIPFTENYNRDASKELSLNKLSDEAIQDYLMFMMRGSEDAVQKTNFFTYLRNTIVVGNEVVNVREYLRTTPEYASFYAGTDAERNARKLKFETDVKALIEEKGVLAVSTFADGVLTIPGVERKSDSVVELRRKVQQFTSDALGNLTEENKRLVGLNVYGKSFMVFKNWIPRLVDVRMGNLKYNAGSDAYEWGRTRMVFRVISEDLTGALSNLANSLKANEKGVDFLRQLYQKKKQDYEEDTGKELEMTESQFMDLVRQGIRNQLVDVLFYAGLMALALGIKALPPEDEDPLVKNQWKFILKATDKLKDEIGYFYDPTSLTQLISSGVFPAVGLIENYKKALSNFMIENYAIATGDEKLQKETYVVKYWMRSFKFTNQMSQLLPLFYPELAKDLGIRMAGQYGIR